MTSSNASTTRQELRTRSDRGTWIGCERRREFLEADLEGLSIITSMPGQTLMLASSQGDSSFHFYRIGRRDRPPRLVLRRGCGRHRRRALCPGALGPQYPLGLLVVQNGEAPDLRTGDDQRLRVRRRDAVQIHRLRGGPEGADSIAASHRLARICSCPAMHRSMIAQRRSRLRSIRARLRALPCPIALPRPRLVPPS